MATDAWEPSCRPVPMSMGIKAGEHSIGGNSFSKWVIISPVKVAESIKSSSQGMRRLTSSKTPLRKYGLSEAK